MGAKLWAVLALVWAVVTVGYWIVAGSSLIAWAMVILTVFFVLMWWMRSRQERNQPS